MKSERIHNILRLGDRRRSLRKNSTSAEIYLWSFLKSKQVLGRKFRRQHGIGNYIVDFYCSSEKLIIELDGKVHDNPNQIIYDRRRDRYLQQLGFKVFRVTNELVFCNVPEVLKLIVLQFEADVSEDPSVSLKADSSP
ncbi:MAG: endonuclease domain-containing protein [Bacteroidota bacterium]